MGRIATATLIKKVGSLLLAGAVAGSHEHVRLYRAHHPSVEGGAGPLPHALVELLVRPVDHHRDCSAPHLGAVVGLRPPAHVVFAVEDVHALQLGVPAKLCAGPAPIFEDVVFLMGVPLDCLVAGVLGAFEVGFLISADQIGLLLSLLAVGPEPPIMHGVVVVVELSVAVPGVVVEVALVVPPVVPGVNSVAGLFVHHVVALVRLDSVLAGSPHPIPVPESLLEVAFERAAVLPDVLAVALGHAVHELPLIVIAVAVELGSFAVLESVFEGSSVEVSVDFLVRSVAVGKSSPPLAFVVLDELVAFGIA